MNWNPFKKKTPEAEPLTDISLSGLKPGYVLDYDLKTWQVSAQHYYDYDGDRVDEWELTCADQVLYLECEDDDGLSWTLSKKIPLAEIDGNLRAYLKENEDPPDQVTHNGVEYFADASDAGHYYKNGQAPGREFIAWDYLDRTEKKTLSIEQWGEDEYEASVGETVEEYQFSDILPSE